MSARWWKKSDKKSGEYGNTVLATLLAASLRIGKRVGAHNNKARVIASWSVTYGALFPGAA